jgi:hypothetical protein
VSDRRWEHDELQDDLARSRIGIGEAVVQKLSLGIWGSAGQIDVWAQKLSRTKPRPTVYEVKVTRADFLADVRAEKHRRYEPAAERCYFATPTGLVDRREAPEGWGLIVRGPNGWSSLKAPRARAMEPHQWRPLMMAVVLSLHPGPWNEPPRGHRVNSIVDHLKHGEAELRGMTKRFGREVEALLNENQSLRSTNRDLRRALDHVAKALGADGAELSSPWRAGRIVQERLAEVRKEAMSA